MASSTGPKTPASVKKLVQARLPFKTLGGSEAPFAATNDTSDTNLITANALHPDNRKRKQNANALKEDGLRAAKLNRSEHNDDVCLETTEAMELSNDTPADEEKESDSKVRSRKSESKENVCVDEISADESVLAENLNEPTDEAESGPCSPKAKQSLDFEGKRTELRKSKKASESGLITIKLPLTRKAKEAIKKGKKQKQSESDVQTKEDTLPHTDVCDEPTKLDASLVMEKDEPDFDQSMDDENLNDSTMNDSALLDVSDKSSTPGTNKLTPKQIHKRVESEKKKQEKERSRIERERKLQEEKELRVQKEAQKKREREEKDEQRKKEKEMREQKLLEEKLEKQREKELKEQQRKNEREEKEEQRKREKEERELQKKKEREEKDREKEDERKKREEEKRQKIEAEQNKNRKTAEAFAKFFVPKKVESKLDVTEQAENMDIDQVPQTFMSFQVKDDMKMAPVIRRIMNREERSRFESLILSDVQSTKKSSMYLSQLKNNGITPRKAARTWLDDDDEKSSNADDLFIMEEDGQSVQVIKEIPKKLYRAKFFKFEENRRPPYYGTWRKKSKTVRARKPLGLDSQLDYEIDSDDEWEEEEPGESLHGSDDEREVESEDEYEIDNEFFVPHGHLSDEELQNEDECEFNDPDDLKFKLKMAQNEFDDERKKKTQKLRPRLIGLIWQTIDVSKPDNCSKGVWELMNKYSVMFDGQSVKVDKPVNQTAENSDDENGHTTKSLGVRRLQIGEKEIPDLIRLINGNQNNSKFLIKEFKAYLAKNHQPQREYSGASIKTKIKELAIWQSCPEEGRMFKKQCWYVPIDTRKRYDLNDLTFPNTWSYTIPPRRPVEAADIECENKTLENIETDKKFDIQDIVQLSDDSNSCTLSETLTPELIKQASSKRTNYNIAKFIRPLTQDEKKKQFEPITLHRRPSEDQMMEKLPDEIPTTSQSIDENDKTARGSKRRSRSSMESAKPKKRINILMSGPLDKEFSPKLKTTLVTQFLTANVRKRKSTDVNYDANDISSTSTAGTSDGAKKTKPNESVIVIDDD